MRRAIVLTTLAVFLPAASGAGAAEPVREPLVARSGGFLTAPSAERPAAVALDYVRARPGRFELDSDDLSGLRLVRSYRFGGGAAHLQWEQRYRGIPVFGPGLRANVDERGRLINVGAGAQPDPRVASIEPRLSALDALLAAGRAAGAAVVPGRPSAPRGAERATTFANGQRASLTIFGERLAWRLRLRGDATHYYDAVVDASNGRTLYRENLVRSATATAFDNYPGAAAGGTQVAKIFPETGNDPWLTETTRLIGDNAHVFSDPADAIDGLPPDPAPAPGEEIPPLAPGDWSYVQDARPASSAVLGQHCPTAGCTWDNFDSAAPNFSWRVNRNQAGTQLFYFVNRYHDHLRDTPGIAFDDSSGNFEAADRVEAQVDDGATTDTGAFDDFPACAYLNNAYVIPVPDGEPLAMQLYLWSNACSTTAASNDVNPADDALVVYHEYTHGMTNRLVTDAAGMPALNGWQAGAMDEGFADWYASDLLDAQGLQPDTAAPGELVVGRYENTPLRAEAFDCPVGAPAAACPGSATAGTGGFTYGDFGKIHPSGPEVHADGEIWVETLWDLRTRLIATYGTTNGLNRARALVTDALRLAPANPSFLNMRNAILQADVNRGFGDRARIWAVFAARGMGAGATTTGSGDVAPRQDFSLPSTNVSPPDPPVAPDRAAPSLARLTLSSKRFRVGRGTVFRFTLSEPATIRISFSRALAGRRVAGRCRAAAALAAQAAALHALRGPGLARPGAHAARRPARDVQGTRRPAQPQARPPSRDARGHRPGGQPLARAAGDVPGRSPALRWRTG